MEIGFGRNGKQNMAEDPFVRSEPGSVASSPEGCESPITAARGCCKQPTGFFRQILLVVEAKIDFRFFFIDKPYYIKYNL